MKSEHKIVISGAPDDIQELVDDDNIYELARLLMKERKQYRRLNKRNKALGEMVEEALLIQRCCEESDRAMNLQITSWAKRTKEALAQLDKGNK